MSLLCCFKLKKIENGSSEDENIFVLEGTFIIVVKSLSLLPKTHLLSRMWLCLLLELRVTSHSFIFHKMLIISQFLCGFCLVSYHGTATATSNNGYSHLALTPMVPWVGADNNTLEKKVKPLNVGVGYHLQAHLLCLFCTFGDIGCVD